MDRVAVVTGAASGIGLGIAEALADEGVRLVLADIDSEGLEREAERLRSSGSQVEAVLTDVGDPDAVQALAERTISRFGAVHLLCNNAGILRGGRVWELSLNDWDAVLRVDLMGVIYGLRSFVPLLLASGEEGHVVNVALHGVGRTGARHQPLQRVETRRAGAERNAARRTGSDGCVSRGERRHAGGRVATRIGQGPGSSTLAPTEPGVIEPAEVGRQVVEAVRQGRLYVFTHPERIAPRGRRLGARGWRPWSDDFARRGRPRRTPDGSTQ